MTTEELAEQLKDIYAYVGKPYNEKDGQEISERITRLSVYLARSAELLSWSQFFYDKAKGDASEEAIKQYDNKLSPTVMKSLVESRSRNEGKLHKACERLNRTITHQIDALRSQLSYLKSFND